MEERQSRGDIKGSQMERIERMERKREAVRQREKQMVAGKKQTETLAQAARHSGERGETTNVSGKGGGGWRPSFPNFHNIP